MLRQWGGILLILFSSSLAYWGVVPRSKEFIQVSYSKIDAARSEITIQSLSLGRKVLEIAINSEAVSLGARRHDVFPTHRKQQTINTSCHYRGNVRNESNSLVILSACSGRFRGSFSGNEGTWYLVYDDEKYVMFPDSSLPSPPEIVTGEYRGIELNRTISKLNAKLQSVTKQRTLSRRSSDDISNMIIEVVVVTDEALWRQLETKSVDVVEFVLSTVSHMDELFKQVGFRVALVGIESWREGDVISVTPSYSYTLRNFTMYRQLTLLDVYKQHDVSVLMTGVDFDGAVIGYAGVGNICRSSCCNVNFNSRSNPAYYGAVIAHEIGHNLGMVHDDQDGGEKRSCPCSDGDACIMSSTIAHVPTHFSDCSQEFLREMDDLCLLNQPKLLYGDPVCGNGFVEEGEECDCGSEQACLLSDPCCEPTGCKLKAGAECYTGECCKGCNFVSYKKRCRHASSECDLDEYCTGTHSQCPRNRYRQDGSECWFGAGFCNYGSCMTRDSQCTSLWGEGVEAGSDVCFQHYNQRGDWYGNCGSVDNGKYIPCDVHDVACGKLFCNVPEGRTPQLQNVYGTTLTYHNSSHDISCTSAKAARGSDNDEVAMVYDGTRCGSDKWCMSGQCVEFEKVLCPSPGGPECGGNGNCNDLNECHCHAGYDALTNCATLLKVAGWDTKKTLIAVSVIVLMVIPVLIMTLLLLRRFNPRVKAIIDSKTRIRFSVRLPSVSRRSSGASGRKSSAKASTNTPDKQTTSSVPLPAPARPPGSYMTSSGWASSSYKQTPPTTPVRPAPVRPNPTYQTDTEESSASSVYIPQKMSSSSYSPMRKEPVRATPPPPPSCSYKPKEVAPLSHIRSPKEPVRVKLDISGPEAARKLINDRPLDERTLGGSPLKNVQR